MTRQEQIQKAALYSANKSIQDKEITYLEFIEAVEWADRTLIEKACNWLNKELFEDKAEPNPYYETDVKSKTYDKKEDFIFNFCKAMEE